MLGLGCACMDYSRVLSAPQTSSVCKESQGLKWDLAGGSCSDAVWGKSYLEISHNFLFVQAVISWLVATLRFTAVYLFSQLNTTGYNQVLNLFFFIKLVFFYHHRDYRRGLTVYAFYDSFSRNGNTRVIQDKYSLWWWFINTTYFSWLNNLYYVFAEP